MKHNQFTRRRALAAALTAAATGLLPFSGPIPFNRGVQAAENGSSITYRLLPVDTNVRRVVVTAMAVDPRGEFIAVAGDDHIIRILDAETMEVAYLLGDGERGDNRQPGHFDWIRTLAFDASGTRLASAGNDGQLLLWDRLNDFSLLQEIDSAPALACVTFAPKAKQIAAVGFDPRIFLIGSTTSTMPRLECDCADLRCCVYQDNEASLAVAGRDGRLHLFAPKTGEIIAEKSLHEGRIRNMAFMPNSNILVSVAEDGEVACFNTASGQVIAKRKITSGRLFTMAVINSQTIAAAGSDDEIYLVSMGDQVEPLRVVATLKGHVGSIATLVVSNHTLISGGFDATMRRWKLPEIQDRVALQSTTENR